LMVGRLTLDQVVKVRILAPQPRKPDDTIASSPNVEEGLAGRPARSPTKRNRLARHEDELHAEASGTAPGAARGSGCRGRTRGWLEVAQPSRQVGGVDMGRRATVLRPTRRPHRLARRHESTS